jgi:hypothetical protein
MRSRDVSVQKTSLLLKRLISLADTELLCG